MESPFGQATWVLPRRHFGCSRIEMNSEECYEVLRRSTSKGRLIFGGLGMQYYICDTTQHTGLPVNEMTENSI